MLSHRTAIVACTTLVFAVVAALAVPARAAPRPSQFSWGQVHVMDAKAFLNTRNIKIDVNQQLEITIQNNPAALAFARHGFQMRFFRADADWRPLPYLKGQPVPYLVFPPCDIFLSSRWLGVSAKGTLLEFGAPGDLGYLAAGPGQKLVDQNWLIIFEDGGDDHDVLRLNGPEADAYFSLAARLVITTGGGAYTTADQPTLTPAYISQLKAFEAEAAVNAPSRDCLHVDKIASSAQARIAKLDQCGRGRTDAAG